MMRRGLSLLLPVSLVASGCALLAAGYYMPDYRQTHIYQPQQDRAEAAVQAIAAAERRLYGKTRQFEPFSIETFAAKSRGLGLDWDRIPSDNFQFDAEVMPDNRLRLRALPRGEAVAALKIPARMFVAELPAHRNVLQSGWYP